MKTLFKGSEKLRVLDRLLDKMITRNKNHEAVAKAKGREYKPEKMIIGCCSVNEALILNLVSNISEDDATEI
jgi:hypothetical protein